MSEWFYIVGLRSSDIGPCLQWMSHFVAILEEDGDPVEVRHFEKILAEDAHNIQTHVVSVTSLVGEFTFVDDCGCVQFLTRDFYSVIIMPRHLSGIALIENSFKYCIPIEIRYIG